MGMSGGSTRRKGQRYAPMAEMNVTPMVDVMLVLLIIFMVAAPMLTQGVQVALPKADAKPIAQEKPVEVSLKADGTIYISENQVDMDTLIPRLQAIQAEREEASIILRADTGLNYGAVMKVMASLQAAGMVDVGLVTTAAD